MWREWSDLSLYVSLMTLVFSSTYHPSWIFVLHHGAPKKNITASVSVFPKQKESNTKLAKPSWTPPPTPPKKNTKKQTSCLLDSVFPTPPQPEKTKQQPTNSQQSQQSQPNKQHRGFGFVWDSQTNCNLSCCKIRPASKSWISRWVSFQRGWSRGWLVGWFEGQIFQVPRERSQMLNVYMAYLLTYMGVSKNRGSLKWMVYNGKPYWNGWFGGYHYFRKHPYGLNVWW